MGEFVNAYDKTTGEKVQVPEHWFDFPDLCRNLSKTPRQKAEEESVNQQSAPAEPTKSGTPGKK